MPSSMSGDGDSCALGSASLHLSPDVSPVDTRWWHLALCRLWGFVLLSEFSGSFGACPDFLVVRRGPRPPGGATLRRLGVSPVTPSRGGSQRPLTTQHLLFQL